MLRSIVTSLILLLTFVRIADAQLIRLGPGGKQVQGVLGEVNGGTAQSTYTLGDILYASGADVLTVLAGNITTDTLYLCQTGTGAESAAPSWCTIQTGTTTGGIVGGQGGSSQMTMWSDQTTGVRATVTDDMSLTGPTVCFTTPATNTTSNYFHGYANTSGSLVDTYGPPTTIEGTDVAGCKTQTTTTMPLTDGSYYQGNILALSDTGTYWSAGIVGSTAQPLGVRFGGAGIGAGLTVYQGIGQGALTFNADEELKQLPVANALTLTKACVVHSGTQPATGTLVFTVRKNEAATAAVVTITAGLGQGRSCWEGSVAYAAGDTLSIEGVNNASTTSAVPQYVMLSTTPTAPMTAVLVFPKGGRTLTASQTRYTPMFINSALNATEANVWSGMPRAGTVKNLRCYVKTGPDTATTTAKVYKNGGATALTVSITVAGGNDYVVSDTSNSFTVVQNDSLSIEWITGTGAVPSISGCTAEFD